MFKGFFSSIVLEYKDGKVEVLKGKISTTTKRDLYGLSETGKVWVSGSGVITFSSDIKASSHQKIRNIICL